MDATPVGAHDFAGRRTGSGASASGHRGDEAGGGVHSAGAGGSGRGPTHGECRAAAEQPTSWWLAHHHHHRRRWCG